MNNRFAKNLKKFREKAGLSQQNLADAVKVSLRTIQNAEKGRVSPRLKNLEAYAKILKIPVGYLL